MKPKRFYRDQKIVLIDNDGFRTSCGKFLPPEKTIGVPKPNEICVIQGYDHFCEKCGMWMITLHGYKDYCFGEPSFMPLSDFLETISIKSTVKESLNERN